METTVLPTLFLREYNCLDSKTTYLYNISLRLCQRLFLLSKWNGAVSRTFAWNCPYHVEKNVIYPDVGQLNLST